MFELLRISYDHRMLWDYKIMKNYLPLAMIILLLSCATSFRSITPEPKTNFKSWNGKWYSSVLRVKGKLSILLPNPIPDGQEFDAKATISYQLGFFGLGKKEMDLAGKFDSLGVSSDISDASERPTYQISFKSKSKTPGSKQIIEYVATIDSKKEIIVGGYKSYSPNDIGTFSIKKVP